MSQILDLEDMGALLAGRGVRGVEHNAQTAVERAEDHSVAAVLIEQRLSLLTPRADDLARRRFGDTDSVVAILEARPYHQQLTRLGAIQEASIRNIRT